MIQMKNLDWIKVYSSPFKRPQISLYMGKTQVGVPYFYPRKWVKYTEEDIQKAMEKHRSNKNYVQHIDSKLYDMYKNYGKAVPLKVGFDWCSLGWKTKWHSDDFRHEWNPTLSFVFFGYQIALTVYSPHHSHYWEPWLYYEYATDKTKSKRERIEQCRKKAPRTWTSHKHREEPITTDYYTKILKSKYL
jgi:hypothetical protein